MSPMCLECHKKIPPQLKAGGNAKKYCNITCRNKAVYKRRGGAQAQRDYLDKRAALDPRAKITCFICFRRFRQVGTHIVQIHSITAREYRKECGFDVKKGQLPPDYRESKAKQAIDCGGVKNLKAGKKFLFKKGQKGVGKYTRSQETQIRLKIQGKKIGQLMKSRNKTK